MQLKVDLAERSYPIIIGSSCIDNFSLAINEVRNKVKSSVIVTDVNVAGYYLNPIKKNLEKAGISVFSVVIPAGERQKNVRRVENILTQMLERRFDRKSILIALGGGVVGDLAGFAASIYQRGIDFIQMPTTLLAQVDSSVGGKVGVNHPLGKNLIGSFYQPKLVFIDTKFLSTLPRREIICGLGEVVKYGIIADEVLFKFLEEKIKDILSLDSEVMQFVIKRCCEIKAEIVGDDEREQKESSGRALLNCGHTIGHAIETALKYRGIKHGEAVLLGLVGESALARLLGMIDDSAYQRVLNLIRQLPLPRVMRKIANKTFYPLMLHDKKTLSGVLRLALPTNIGEATIVEGVDRKLLRDALHELREFENSL